MNYECDTLVKDGMVAVPSTWDGRRVHVIVITLDEIKTPETDPFANQFAEAVPGIRFSPLSRDEAHQRP